MDASTLRVTALIVIDMQNAFRAGWVDGDGTIERIRLLVERARAAGAPVMWVQDEESLVRGSDEWQMPAELAPAPGEARIYKHHWDAFTEPQLKIQLTDAGVTRVALSGAHTDYCIRTNGLRAVMEGFDVVVVGDAHTTHDSLVGDHTLSGEAIIAHTNLYFAGLSYPGRTVTVEDYDAVEFGSPAY